ncbi:slipin family protein [Thalassoglobus sp. JC818]|uniref:slipin family protein n=1 Tax=Thalassoglobus sp. JC818 TaxID=3232136 RepID=UPI003459D85A
MFIFKRYKIRSYEMGLLFRDEEFRGLVEAGTRWFFDPLGKVRVEIVSQRDPWLVHEKLDLIVKSAAGAEVGSDRVPFLEKMLNMLVRGNRISPVATLKDRAVVLDLKDHERALVWIENRFSHVVPSGLYAYWTGLKDVRVEVVDARNVRFEHDELKVIAKSPMVQRVLDVCSVNRDRVGVLFIDGRFVDTLSPGLYAFWKGQSEAKIAEIDLRETMVDVGGQDIMTADKVTLRLNAVVTYKIDDARKAVSQTDDVRQALYRETQLVLRSVIGARDLDVFLTEKDAVASEIEESVRRRAGELGLEIASVGIRDVILPGDMKDLMNKVTEARKAAEANLISRREETAAMRSQANTAKLLADNPVLMRLRELEVLEKIAASGKLNIVLGDKTPGEKGLADKVINLL